jgi:hypothetical protein
MPSYKTARQHLQTSPSAVSGQAFLSSNAYSISLRADTFNPPPDAAIEPNSGIVTVPDDRLQVLSDISKSKELVRLSALAIVTQHRHGMSCCPHELV